MVNQNDTYITLSWQELGPLKTNGRRLLRQGRQVYAPRNYPRELPCHNPNCQDGGFEIGDKISNLLVSNLDSEQNSLICRNAIHQDKTKRCLHTILYSIAQIYPYAKRDRRAKPGRPA
jgi:hypothetical protein